MDDDAAELSELLCFDLYAASRAVTALYRRLLADLDLTYPQYLVLVLLWRRGPLPIKDIAGSLHLDYGTLTPLLQRLEAKGLLARTRRSDDERSVSIALTPQGDALRGAAHDVQGAVRTAMGLDPGETLDLQGQLRRLAGSVEAAVTG
ncbi:MAG: MarR family transcriptional regulator [Actinobacteria bacterium]|jgi:DNA-binding MarR family transcriptional regulator|uniref:MarR family transcriptional regulator n=2 Tax=root TaxID=1 RepID=A0ABU8EBI2_9ACTN|nr:MarR family transcriptional regulator [Klenkia terrae]MSW64947.1 MarR family transcriptional regulator [Actinomycetota bacterium]SSC24221.1 MarR-type HTH domain [Klenkia terrae]